LQGVSGTRPFSSRPFPNPPGTFQCNGLSREVAPPVSGLSPCGSRPPPHPLGCVHLPLHPFPCGTMGALSPCPSRGLGDPEVHTFPWSVRRSIIGRLARSLRVLLEGAFTGAYPMSPQLQAQVIAPSSCGRSSTTSRLTFAPFGLTLYGLACTASWERVLPSLRFQSMLLSPSAFASRSGSALLTFAPVRLDSSNKEKACASAHGYYDGSDFPNVHQAQLP
jgi:hypothetical protein